MHTKLLAGAAVDRRRFLGMSLGLGGAAAIGGCSTLAQLPSAITDISNNARTALAAACKWQPVASAAWTLVQGFMPAVVVAGVTAAFGVLTTACTSTPTDLATTIVNVDNAINTIMAAISGTPAKNAKRGARAASIISDAIAQGRQLQNQFAPLVRQKALRRLRGHHAP